MRIEKVLILIIVLLFSSALFAVPSVRAYTPHQGDYFNYSETQAVTNGYGTCSQCYGGYSDRTVVNGGEQIKSITNGNVSAHYSYTWNWSDNSNNRNSGNSSGNFTFSSTSLLYLKGTDNQTGYTGPITVWFAIDSSMPVGTTFYLLDTLMTVKSTSYSYSLSSQNKNVNAIFAEGTGYYHRNDSYGKFSATYSWDTYFDPSSGYIIGYNWDEQDTNSSLATGFTYSESLYVTSTSYPLTTAATSSGFSQYFGLIIGLIIFLVIIVLIIVLAYSISRRRRTRIPKNLFQQPPQQLPQQPPPQINLNPKEPPVQQIVVREIVKVKCRYCGALIDATVQTCPFCGAPRT